MSLANIVRGILNLQKKINVKTLPSQGLFYKDDFELWIKKADVEDIIEYEHQYEKEDLGLVITRVKKIVEKKHEVVIKPEPKINNTQYKKFSYNQYSLYQEVKEKSEKIAHLKMVDDISSDDNIDDSYY